jgi:hypothetical protein
MRLTRRKLGSLALSAGVAAPALAQVATGQQAPEASGRDWDREARESRRDDAAALARFELAVSVAPAFQFRA